MVPDVVVPDVVVPDVSASKSNNDGERIVGRDKAESVS